MKDEPREMFPIRFMSFDGQAASTAGTDTPQYSAVVDFRASVLPADAEDPVQPKAEADADGPKDSSAIEPVSASDDDSSEPVTPIEPTPSLLGPPAKTADAEKVLESRPPFLPPIETGSN